MYCLFIYIYPTFQYPCSSEKDTNRTPQLPEDPEDPAGPKETCSIGI